VTVLVLGALLAGCTATAPTTDTPTLGPPSAAPTAEPGGSGGGGGPLPACELVAAAVFGLVDPLEFDSATSLAQEAQEEYDQRVCVYRSADGAAAIGITIAAIPFQQTELDGYAARPNALPDARLEARHAVLQTFEAGDGDDGYLDSPLYLIDTSWSVTIQGLTEGSTVAVLLPQLTVTTATDAAFAVRDLVG
jgi:hypothetical protein